MLLIGGLLTLTGGFFFDSKGVDKVSSSGLTTAAMLPTGGSSAVVPQLAQAAAPTSTSVISAAAAASPPAAPVDASPTTVAPANPATGLATSPTTPPATSTTAPPSATATTPPPPTSTTAPPAPTATTPPPPTATTAPPAPTPTTAPPAGGGATALSSDEQALLRDHNAERAKVGIAALQLDARLVGVARQRAQDMATNNYFSHTSPSGQTAFTLLANIGYVYAIAGENIARNNYPADQAENVAMTGFMNSPGHKANILDSRFQYVGIGTAVGSDGMRYFAVVFAGN